MLLVLPVVLTAQVGRVPRTGRGRPDPTQPRGGVPLPPEIPTVARALAYKRSRWSTEGYGIVSSLAAPAVTGGLTRYTAMGAGTHTDFQFSRHFAATADMTYSWIGGPLAAASAEAGTRFRPRGPADLIRPYFDLRATYMHMDDRYATPDEPSGGIGGAQRQGLGDLRYARGVGTVLGSGFEYSLTNSFSITTEAAAMRSHMRAYRSAGATDIPGGTGYWMTSFRYVLGLKYSPVRALHLTQKPSM